MRFQQFASCFIHFARILMPAASELVSAAAELSRDTLLAVCEYQQGLEPEAAEEAAAPFCHFVILAAHDEHKLIGCLGDFSEAFLR